jgi:hypothetical protein
MSDPTSSVAKSEEKPLGWIELNSDKNQAVLVRSSDDKWVQTSQAGGVSRKMLERLGGEVARATSVVKFDPHQAFPRHSHSGGEEFVVLEGVWRDDYGAFPKYSYIRNYIGSGHTPSIGAEGCVILVKLRQMSHLSKDEPEHRAWTESNPEDVRENGKSYATNPDAKRQSLFESELEKTAVHTWPKQTPITVQVPPNGMEIFVLDGTFTSKLGHHDQWSWCRIPNDGDSPLDFEVTTGSDEDVYVWTKEGHLNSDEVGLGM